jgi:hypothetical protein
MARGTGQLVDGVVQARQRDRQCEPPDGTGARAEVAQANLRARLDTPAAPPLSERHAIAERLSNLIQGWGLTDTVKGTVRRGEKAYELAFSDGAPNYPYGEITIFNPGYLALYYQSGDARLPSSERRVFRCERDLARFIESAFVVGDVDAALAVPLHVPRRPRSN